MARPQTRLASATVPFIIRFLILNLEPLFAIGGVFLLLTDPAAYTANMTRQAFTSIQPASEFIYTELWGGWLHFAFTEAVVLRLLDDYRVWKLLSIGMLLSDVAYCHSCAQGVGGWAEWVKVANWTTDEWIVTITTWPFVLARLAIVTGIGMHKKTE